MKLLCSCLSEQSANSHTHTHTDTHIQRHTRALPAAVFVVPPALPQRTQQQQPDTNALPTQAATAKPAATVLSLSLSQCACMDNRKRSRHSQKYERAHTRTRTHTKRRRSPCCTHVLVYTCAKSVRARQTVNYLESTGSRREAKRGRRRERERRAAFDLRL